MTRRVMQFGLSSMGVLSLITLANMLVFQPHAASRAGRGANPVPAPAHEVLPSTTDAVAMRAAVWRELQALGYAVGANGAADDAVTQAAIFAYEVDHGLQPTAVASEALLATIVLGSAVGRSGDTHEALGLAARALVVRVQTALTAAGDHHVAVDGQLGRPFSEAIQAFERDHGLPVSGRISGRLVLQLKRIPAAARAFH